MNSRTVSKVQILDAYYVNNHKNITIPAFTQTIWLSRNPSADFTIKILKIQQDRSATKAQMLVGFTSDEYKSL